MRLPLWVNRVEDDRAIERPMSGQPCQLNRSTQHRR
jgi:hypothetical protein